MHLFRLALVLNCVFSFALSIFTVVPHLYVLVLTFVSCIELITVRCVYSSWLCLLQCIVELVFFTPPFSGTSAVWYLCYLAPLLFGAVDDEPYWILHMIC